MFKFKQELLYMLQLIINGQEYSRRTSVEPISEVVQVYFDGDVELEYLNIWCV